MLTWHVMMTKKGRSTYISNLRAAAHKKKLDELHYMKFQLLGLDIIFPIFYVYTHTKRSLVIHVIHSCEITNSSLNKATMPPVLLLLSLLGLLSLTKPTLSSLYYAYAFFLRPAKDLKAHYGSWAIVTGPTQGIGQAMAFELARKKLNLILIGRNPKKLELVGTAIKEKHNIDVKALVIDFAGDLNVGLKQLKEIVAGLDVGVLVNNAGVANRNAKYFGEGGVEEWMEMVKVNLEALTEVTRVILKGMVERKRGAVVNIGSGSSVVVPSFPLFSVYAGTKA